MARSGDVIENPLMGGRIVFRKTARETRGELLSFDFFLKPQKGVARAHYHPVQQESFQVMKGTMRGHAGGEQRSVRQGERMAVPPGVPHEWWNDSSEEAHLVVEFRPALHTETFFETVFGLARDGKSNSDGLPGPLQMCVMLADYGDEFCPVGLPSLVRSAVVVGVAPVAKLLGYRSRYPRYTRDWTEEATRGADPAVHP